MLYKRHCSINEEKMIRIAIVDYGMGNLFSISNACKCVGFTPFITNSIRDIMKSDAIILPGVGAFGDAMKSMIKLDLVSPIIDYAASGKFIFGICLGMQLLMTESSEFGRHKGLGIIEGFVEIFNFSDSSQNEYIKIPHIGWTGIKYKINDSPEIWDNTPLNNVKNGTYMYFVHSYYVKPDNEKDILSISSYGNTIFCSSIKRNNIFGCQFHPERSAENGILVYKNLISIIKNNII